MKTGCAASAGPIEVQASPGPTRGLTSGKPFPTTQNPLMFPVACEEARDAAGAPRRRFADPIPDARRFVRKVAATSPDGTALL